MPDMAFRPRFHFLPVSNWINDPNGLIEWEGQYHLFYQANPETPDFGRMVWGHAVSPDLVHWERRSIALRPDTPADQDGCWTGCAVDYNGVPTLVYTGRVGETENVCRATSPDGLRTFIKPANNRLDVFPPLGERLAGFRDPYAWRESDGWYMVVEVFANDRLSLTSRVYPTLPDSVGVRLFSSGGPAAVKTVRIWGMKPIW
jgi:beta-fructofuranosidase